MIKKVAGGYKVLSEKGKNLGGPYKSKAAAQKRLRQVEYFKHKKGRASPRIFEEGGYWHIMQGEQRTLSFADPLLAEEALRFMQSVKPFEFGYQLETSLGEIRRASQDMQQLAREYIALYTTGRI